MQESALIEQPVEEQRQQHGMQSLNETVSDLSLVFADDYLAEHRAQRKSREDKETGAIDLRDQILIPLDQDLLSKHELSDNPDI